MNVKRIGLGIGLVLVLLMTAGCKPAAVEEGPIVPTPTEEQVQMGLEVFGQVKGEAVPISFDLEMKVLQKLVKTGDLVEKGSPLFTFNRDQLEKLAALKQMELNAVSSKLDGGSTEYARTSNTIADLEKSVMDKKQELAHQKSLYADGMVSQSEITAIESALRGLTTDLDNARLSLKQQGLSDNSVQASEQAELKKLELQFDTYDEMLRSGLWVEGDRVICPFEKAIVESFDLNALSFVEPRSVILKLIDVDSLYIEAEVSEEFITQVQLGDLAEIKPLFDKDKLYKGRVTRISHLPYEKNGEMVVPVWITVDDKDGLLLPNFNVDVKILKKNKAMRKRCGG